MKNSYKKSKEKMSFRTKRVFLSKISLTRGTTLKKMMEEKFSEIKPVRTKTVKPRRGIPINIEDIYRMCGLPRFLKMISPF